MRHAPDGVVGRETRVGVRRDGGGRGAVRQRDERALRDDDVVGEAPVDRQARELVVDAEHVDAAPAGHAEAAAVRWEDEHGVALGNRRHAFADLLHPAGVLMPEHARESDAGGLHQPFQRVQVGRAHSRAADADEHVGRTLGLRHRPFDELERLVIFTHECRFHGSPIGVAVSSERTSSLRYSRCRRIARWAAAGWRRRMAR
jgi:hypothetical protein